MDGFISLSPTDVTTPAGMAKLNNMLQALFQAAPGDGNTIQDLSGYGSPNGVVTAATGSTYRQIDGSGTTAFWTKGSGTGNTGWISPPSNPVLIGVANAAGDIYTSAWADYSGTSTIIGWASFANKAIYIKTIGKLVLVQFAINGTSNSTTTTFTVPVATDSNTPAHNIACTAIDNGGTATLGVTNISGGSVSTIKFFTSVAAATWTASGNKVIEGQFWYQST